MESNHKVSLEKIHSEIFNLKDEKQKLEKFIEDIKQNSSSTQSEFEEKVNKL
jgi:hypothetical protein